MSKDKKYIIHCWQFANSHDDRIYTCADFDSAKELFKRVSKEYHEYLMNIGLHIAETICEGPRTKKEAEEFLPSVTFITDDNIIFEVYMVRAK